MDPVADRDLASYLEAVPLERMPTLRCFFGCLATATVYLHSHKVFHLDIKPQNILIKGNKVYMADFGAAHDRSGRDRSTTWSSNQRTTAYMPPERDLDPHAPTNYATDIWSLGVVFLEMLTVLRGSRPEQFWDHLKQKGTQHPFPYKNPTGTISWLEVLRQGKGPDYDNIPQSWIKDMLVKDNTRRPYAKQLRDLTLEAVGFCGFCCSVVEQDDGAHDHFDTEQEERNIEFAYRELEDDFEELTDADQGASAKDQSIQSWIQRTEVATARATEIGEETEGFEFDIEDDDDLTVDAADRSQGHTRPSSQRLSTFDFLAGFGGLPTQPSDHELAFSIDSDHDDNSEAGAELRDAAPDVDLASITQQLDALVDTSAEEWKLPTIAEDSEFTSYEVLEAIDASPTNFDTDGLQLPGSCGVPTVVDPHRLEPDLIQPANQTGKDEGNLFPSIASTQGQSYQAPASEPVHVSFQEPQAPAEITIANQPTSISSRNKDATSASMPSVRPRESSFKPQRRDLTLPQALTVQNVSQLDSSLPKRMSLSSTRGTKKSSRISARRYMRKVSVETDSEATSVMSEGARKQIKGLSLTVWVNKSTPLLQQYVSAGKVSVVRALLEAGCMANVKVGMYHLSCLSRSDS